MWSGKAHTPKCTQNSRWRPTPYQSPAWYRPPSNHSAPPRSGRTLSHRQPAVHDPSLAITHSLAKLPGALQTACADVFVFLRRPAGRQAEGVLRRASTVARRRRKFAPPHVQRSIWFASRSAHSAVCTHPPNVRMYTLWQAHYLSGKSNNGQDSQHGHCGPERDGGRASERVRVCVCLCVRYLQRHSEKLIWRRLPKCACECEKLLAVYVSC